MRKRKREGGNGGRRKRKRGREEVKKERAQVCECLMTLGSKENFYSFKPALYAYLCCITV